MSVTWSRDFGGNDWGSGSEWGFPQMSKRTKLERMGNNSVPKIEHSEIRIKNIIPNVKSNDEGYSGNPTSFIDVDDRRVKKYQIAYSEHGRKEFRKNIDLVGKLIQCGVVMPTEQLMLKSVEKLKKIASGENG